MAKKRIPYPGPITGCCSASTTPTRGPSTEVEAVNARWSTREMERQIHSLLFERLALSRDKAGVLALAQKGHEISRPSDLIKNTVVLEFATSARTSGSASQTWSRP